MEHAVVVGVGQRVVPGIGTGGLHIGSQGVLDHSHLGGHDLIHFRLAATLKVHGQQQDDQNRQPDHRRGGVLHNNSPQQQNSKQHHVARVDVIHRQQHQRNGGAAKQGTGFQHHRAALALIPKQAAHRRQHDHQEGDAAAADVSLAALDGGPDIVEPGVAQQGRCAGPLIANRRDGVALQQQLHAVKIHAAVTEIGRGQLSHRKERDAEPRRCRDKADVAAPFVLPHRRQREHPEQQRVGAEDRFHRAGRRADGKPAGLIGAVQRRSTAHDEKRQHIVHGLRRAADAGADGHGNGKQTGTEHNALPPVQRCGQTPQCPA